MTECLADEWSRPTPELCRLYETWSKGGTALLITGNVQIDRRYMERPGNVAIDGAQNQQQMEALAKYARSGQKYNGSKIFVQLGHAGRQCTALVSTTSIGPSDIALQSAANKVCGKPRKMTL
eukprot:CAMPEP_0197062690 /NCGR_PEP_ID=MMETSP1384-20130603/146996_1 /TAXON_ID=29189 /ORGANISM="Ammonia sp." /LENGTH=121 /DNA_ID=CAMNT_0042498727 /DNA_START=13 /DNA_END=374 /DNA_ORIENTATION=-